MSDRRRVEVPALEGRARSPPTTHLGARGDGRLDLASTTFARCAAETIGPDVGRRDPCGSPTRSAAVCVDERGRRSRRRRRVDDVEALGRGADLAGVQVARPRRRRARRRRGRRRRADDERVLAAHLEVDARERSAQAAAIRLPVSTEPVKATQSTRGSSTIALADVAGAGDDVDHAGRQVRRSTSASASVDSGVSSRRLADDGVAGGERRARASRPAAAAGSSTARCSRPTPSGSLMTKRQLGRLDRGDHAAGELRADLGVVVEAAARPARPRRGSRCSGLPPSSVSSSERRARSSRMRRAASWRSWARSMAGCFRQWR